MAKEGTTSPPTSVVPRIRTFAVAGVALMVFITPLITRCRVEASSHFDRGAALQAEHRDVEAAEEYRRALSWRTPFHEPPARASLALFEMARAPSRTPESAREIFAELERGLASSRSWVWGLLGTWRGVTESAVTELRASLLPVPPASVSRSPQPPSIHYGWQAGAQVTFWLWIGTTLLVIWQGFDKSGRIHPKQWRLFAFPLVFFGGWLVALSFA